MKQKLLLAFIILFTIKSQAQDLNFSLEGNYPIPIDNNFIGENYYGLIDLGLKYRFLDLSIVSLGAGINGGVLISNSFQNELPQDYQVTAYTIQPKVFAELNLESIPRLRPFLGLGYTFMTFKFSGSNYGEDISNLKEKRDGFGGNIGAAFDVTKKFFVQAHYDFTLLNANEVPNEKYNTNISLLKLGIGLRF